MPPSTEAFAVLAFENCHDCWLEQFALKELFPAYKLAPSKKLLKEGDEKWVPIPRGSDGNPLVVPKDKDGVPEYQFKKGTEIGMLGAKYKGVYTKSDCGSDKSGGWTNEGLTRFNTLVAANKAARATELGGTLEQQVLEHLRQVNGVTESNHALHLRSRSRKRKGSTEPEEKVGTWEDDSEPEPEDNEDEGEESGEDEGDGDED